MEPVVGEKTMLNRLMARMNILRSREMIAPSHSYKPGGGGCVTPRLRIIVKGFGARVLKFQWRC